MFDYGIDFKKRSIMNFYERKLLRKYLNGSLTDNDIKQYIYKSDVSFGYPVGRISMDKRIAYYRSCIEATKKDVFSDFNREKRYAMKKRILNRISFMDNICFFTQTFNPENIPDVENAYIHYWRNVFSKCGINTWCLISDYGSKKGRLHFHGFLDLSSCSDYVEFDGKFYHFKPLVSYGFNKCIFLDNTCIDRSVNYCIKYMFKDLSFDSRHKLYGSRISRADSPLIDKINSYLGFNVKIL